MLNPRCRVVDMPCGTPRDVGSPGRVDLAAKESKFERMSKTVLFRIEGRLTFFGETVCILHPGLWRILCVLLSPNIGKPVHETYLRCTLCECMRVARCLKIALAVVSDALTAATIRGPSSGRMRRSRRELGRTAKHLHVLEAWPAVVIRFTHASRLVRVR